MPEQRFYREFMQTKDLCCFNVTEQESDLQIFAGAELALKARAVLRKYRGELRDYSRKHPDFLHSLVPIKPDPNSPEIVVDMCQAAQAAQVGPMAAVAGALAQYVGRALAQETQEIIIENGGDIFLKSSLERKVSIYAGDSPFSNRIALLIPGDRRPWGICTSSGTVGHALSFGKADAAVIVARDAILADAAATAVGNQVTSAAQIEKGIATAMSIPGVEGVLIISGDKMGAYGKINLTKP